MKLYAINNRAAASRPAISARIEGAIVEVSGAGRHRPSGSARGLLWPEKYQRK